MKTIEQLNRIRTAIIGGGSVVFCQTLIRDILAGATKAVDFNLMAPTECDYEIPMRHGVDQTDIDRLAGSPMVLTGTPAEMAERLSELSERHGIGAVMVPMPQLEALGAVIPHL